MIKALTVMPHDMSWELAVCAIFLGLSLLCYALLGGADYGAGIVELSLRGGKHTQARRTLENALGPVWEANHIWLILTVVILFVGFPTVYSALSIHLHLPVTAVLLGIIARGTSYTFRHYDAIRDGSRNWYNWTFRLSSLWTPFWLGITLGGMTAGRLPNSLSAAADFKTGFISPWLHGYGVALGLFSVCLFAFLAAVFAIGESAETRVRMAFARRARFFLALAIPLGAMVFLGAQKIALPLFKTFVTSPGAWTGVVASLLILPGLEMLLRRATHANTTWTLFHSWLLRGMGGALMMTIMGAWFAVQYPVLFRLPHQASLTLLNAASAPAALRQLALALLVGSAGILPSLFWLFRVFQKPTHA
jgi:cytochrome bd ubiquinol oxidase subunit II